MNLIKQIKEFINTKVLKLYFVKRTPFFCYYELKDIKNSSLNLCTNCYYCKGYILKNSYIKPIKGTKGYSINSQKWKKK